MQKKNGKQAFIKEEREGSAKEKLNLLYLRTI